MTRAASDRSARVILASAGVGAGHNQAAAAIQAALAEADPAVQADFVDSLALVPGWFRVFYAGGYCLCVTRLPWLYGLGYRLTDRPEGPDRRWSERSRLLVEKLLTRRLGRFLARGDPALVVATHYLPLPAIGRLARAGAPLRCWVVITDHEAHRFWYSPDVERYFVASEAVKRQVQRWGVDPARIDVSGIPVHPKWSVRQGGAEVRRSWRLPADGAIVIISGGAFFTVGPVANTARGILAGCDAHVVVLAGTNKKLLARVAGMPQAGRRLTPVAFTDRVHELVEVASLVVTKAGGLFTAECIAKGTPMVLTRPVPGQEAANAEMLARAGAAVLAESDERVIAESLALLADEAKRQALAAAAARLQMPAADTIVGEILRAVR